MCTYRVLNFLQVYFFFWVEFSCNFLYKILKITILCLLQLYGKYIACESKLKLEILANIFKIVKLLCNSEVFWTGIFAFTEWGLWNALKNDVNVYSNFFTLQKLVQNGAQSQNLKIQRSKAKFSSSLLYFQMTIGRWNLILSKVNDIFFC